MRNQDSDQLSKNETETSTERTETPAASELAERARHSDRLKLVDSVYDATNDHLIEHISSLLSVMPAHIEDVLSKELNSQDEIPYLTIQRFLKAEEDNITREFFVAVNNRVRPGLKDDDEDSLALVSEEEMEEMVATTTMQAHAMSLYSEEINNLEARLEYLEITTENAIEKESLNPRRIGDAFLITLRELNLGVKERLRMLEIFDAVVTPKLGSMYKEINTMLIEAGVMPSIVLKNADKDDCSNEEVATRVANYYDPQEKVETNFIPRTPHEIAQFASQFMKGQFVASESAIDLPESFTKPVTTTDADGRHYYARKDVMHALSKLQNELIKKGKEAQQASIDEIKQSLFCEIGKQEGGIVTKQVNVLDERSIDFVGMMFSAIMDDQSITKIIKNLLLRLQIPVIKVAMSDTNLFEGETHPTKEVLNLVSEAGKGVTEETDRVYGELENIVDDILEEFDVDIKSFNKAADSLHSLIESEQKIARENEEREQRAVMVAHAREVVVGEIQHISANKIIPKNVLPLITKSWPSLMMNRYIRHGNDSWPWMESVMLMKLLVRCLQPIKTDNQWQTVWSNHMALIEAVKDELLTTKQAKDSVEDQVENLKDTFLDLLDAYGYKMVENESGDAQQKNVSEDLPEDAIPAANDEDIEHAAKLEEVARLAQEKLGQLPNMVHPGVWFEIYNGEDKAVRRLKLSVILTGIAKLVFVDRKGVKVIEKDAADFAAELSSDKSRFIADHSTFEHALGQVIHSIAA